MTPNEVRTILFEAAKLRMPRFEDRDTTGMRIEKLETHLLTMAMVRGDLEEGRLHIQQALHDLQEKWDEIEGWELYAPDSQRARTREVVETAKRRVGPDEEALYQGIRDARFLIARLTEQINRLSHMGDDQVASRIYTLLAGS